MAGPSPREVVMLTPKRAIFFLMIVGSTLGGWLPTAFGQGAFSMASVVCSMLGGFAGIWAGWRLTR